MNVNLTEMLEKDQNAPVIPKFMMPHPALQPYIQSYSTTKAGIEGKWISGNMIPPGFAVMIIFFEGKKVSQRIDDDPVCCLPPVMFSGQVSRFRRVSFYDQFATFFVRFRSCGAYSLLGIDQHACTDASVDIVDILGAEGKSFAQELADQHTAEGIRAIVEKFFLQRIFQPKKADLIKRLVYVDQRIHSQCKQPYLIKNICREEGFTIKSLERYTKEIIGVNPKYYQRIIRINAVMKYINQLPSPPNWAQTAYQFGFADQTHFINEFKLFCGNTPTAYSLDEWQVSSVASNEEHTLQKVKVNLSQHANVS